MNKKHKGTLNAANAGKVSETAQTAMGEMEAKMSSAIVEGEKQQRVNIHKRQARTTEDDKEWQKLSGHVLKKRKRREDNNNDDEEDEEDREEEEEEEEEESDDDDDDEEEEEDEIGEVASIQEIRITRSGVLELLVRWVDYTEEFDTWLPFTQLGNALECVEDFIKTHLL
jgi:hypothetical protein